jgi:hypothetical protein
MTGEQRQGHWRVHLLQAQRCVGIESNVAAVEE